MEGIKHESLFLYLNNKVYEQIDILTGTSVTINTLADVLIKEIGVEVKKIFKQLQMGDPEHLKCDHSKSWSHN